MARKLLRLSKRGLGLNRRRLTVKTPRVIPRTRDVVRLTRAWRGSRTSIPSANTGGLEETDPIWHYIPFAGVLSPDPELNYPDDGKRPG